MLPASPRLGKEKEFAVVERFSFFLPTSLRILPLFRERNCKQALPTVAVPGEEKSRGACRLRPAEHTSANGSHLLSYVNCHTRAKRNRGGLLRAAKNGTIRGTLAAEPSSPLTIVHIRPAHVDISARMIC